MPSTSSHGREREPSAFARKRASALADRSHPRANILGCGIPAAWIFGFFVVVILLSLIGCAGPARFAQAQATAGRNLLAQGWEAVQQGKWNQAEDCLSRAVQAQPEDEKARSQYAAVLWHRGAQDDAIVQMSEAVRLSQGDPSLRIQLGEMHLARGELQQAWNEAESALANDRARCEAWALRGDVQKKAGRLQDALDDYHRALCYREHFPRVQLEIAQIQSQLGRPQRALSVLQRLEEQYPAGQAPTDVLAMQGLCLQSLERHEEAATMLAKAVRQQGPNTELLYRLAESQFHAGHADAASTSLEHALRLSPKHGPSVALMSRVEEAQRQLETARSLR